MDNEQLVKRKDNLESLLKSDKFREALADVAPRQMTPERIVKIAMVAMSRAPRLLECTPQSVLQSVMKSAELGLDCVGTLGQGYLVPYYNSKIQAYECQFIAGYQGLIELARRSGNIARIESRVVYENDQFDFEYGLNQRLVHKPQFTGERGKILCVYALAELKDGSKQLEVMTIEEVEGIRNRSKAKESGPWVTDFSEMARKTVVRRLAKYLPLSPELVKVIEADDQQYDFDSHAVAANMQAGVEALKERIAAKHIESEQPDDSNPPVPIGDAMPIASDLPESEPEPADMPEPVESGDPELEGKKQAAKDKLAAASEKPKRARAGRTAGKSNLF
jgi:recombination protein RecT